MMIMWWMRIKFLKSWSVGYITHVVSISTPNMRRQLPVVRSGRLSNRGDIYVHFNHLSILICMHMHIYVFMHIYVHAYAYADAKSICRKFPQHAGQTTLTLLLSLYLSVYFLGVTRSLASRHRIASRIWSRACRRSAAFVRRHDPPTVNTICNWSKPLTSLPELHLQATIRYRVLLECPYQDSDRTYQDLISSCPFLLHHIFKILVLTILHKVRCGDCSFSLFRSHCVPFPPTCSPSHAWSSHSFHAIHMSSEQKIVATSQLDQVKLSHQWYISTNLRNSCVPWPNHPVPLRIPHRHARLFEDLASAISVAWNVYGRIPSHLPHRHLLFVAHTISPFFTYQAYWHP